MIYIVIATLLALGLFFYISAQSLPAKYSDITTSQLKELLRDQNITLIDVRTQKEVAQGVIGNPLLLELGPSLENKMKELDRSKNYVLYCRSGRRSAIASSLMTQRGFSNVSNLVGGYNAWCESK